MHFLQCTASPWGPWPMDCLVLCSTLHCVCLAALHLLAVGVYRLFACGQWAVALLLCTTTPAGGRGLRSSSNAPPHCLGVVVNGQWNSCVTAWGQWAAELLQCTAAPPVGGVQCNPCNTLRHRLGAVGGGTPVLCCVVLCCVVLCCVVLCCVVLCCVVPRALLPLGNGPFVYSRVQVNRRAVCLARAPCVIVWLSAERGAAGKLGCRPRGDCFHPNNSRCSPSLSPPATGAYRATPMP